MKFNCPHCGTRMRIRTSRPMSLLSRELYMQCPNVACAYVCRSLLSTSHTVAPSINPNPLVYVPLGRVRNKPDNPKQLELLPD